MQPLDPTETSDSGKKPPFWVSFMGFALFVTVLSSPFLFLYFCQYSSVNPWLIFKHSLPFCLPVICIVLWCARTRSVTWFLLVFLVPFSVFTGYFFLYQINIGYDESEAEIVESVIIQKSLDTGLGYRRRQSYTVSVANWHDFNEPNIVLHVSDVFHKNHRTTPGNHMRLWVHKGYLGYEWIEKFEVVEGSATMSQSPGS